MEILKSHKARYSASSRARRTLLLSLALLPAAHGQSSVNIPTYFEFGSVVSLGQHNIDIQTYDQQKQRLVQHSFVLSRDTRADIVHVGDTVEVIFTPGTDWTVRRLVLLTAGIPKEGP